MPGAERPVTLGSTAVRTFGRVNASVSCHSPLSCTKVFSTPKPPKEIACLRHRP